MLGMLIFHSFKYRDSSDLKLSEDVIWYDLEMERLTIGPITEYSQSYHEVLSQSLKNPSEILFLQSGCLCYSTDFGTTHEVLNRGDFRMVPMEEEQADFIAFKQIGHDKHWLPGDSYIDYELRSKPENDGSLNLMLIKDG